MQSHERKGLVFIRSAGGTSMVYRLGASPAASAVVGRVSSGGGGNADKCQCAGGTACTHCCDRGASTGHGRELEGGLATVHRLQPRHGLKASSGGSWEGADWPHFGSGSGRSRAPLGAGLVFIVSHEVRCGPDITDEFMGKLKRALAALDNELSDFDSCRKIASLLPGAFRADADATCKHMANFASSLIVLAYCGPGGEMDWKPIARRSGKNEAGKSCPTLCGFSLEFCGICLNADFPGNFALGVLCGYSTIGANPALLASMWDYAWSKFRRERGYGSYYGNKESDSAPDAPVGDPDERTVDQPAITAGAELGKRLREMRAQDRGHQDEDGKDLVREAVCAAVKEIASAVPESTQNCPKCAAV